LDEEGLRAALKRARAKEKQLEPLLQWWAATALPRSDAEEKIREGVISHGGGQCVSRIKTMC
jgi:hypothetical protein